MAGRLPDPYLVTTTKLSQEWSANRGVPHISEQWLEALLADERFSKIDSMVKCRLILASVLALNQPAYQDNIAAKAELQRSLQKLQKAVAGDDEWVKVLAAAAGPLDGRLHLDTVVQQSAVVQETVTQLKEQVQNSTNQHMYPPLEDLYLSSSGGFELNPDSGHFTLRHNPRVQPLTTGVSYAAATPPPPALHSPRQGDQVGVANPAWIRQKQQKADILRTASLTPGGPPPPVHSTPMPTPAAAAAAGDGPAGPMSRGLKSSQVKVPRLQMLDEDEQEEMNKLIKQQSVRKKDKGHGFSLRHTEGVEHLVATTSTRVRHEDYNTPAAAAAAAAGGGTGFRSAGIRLKKEARGDGNEAAAAGWSSDGRRGGGGGGAAGGGDDDYYANVKDDEDDDFIVRGEVDYRLRDSDRGEGNAGDDEEAMYGVTGAVERDIDELFEDSGSGDEGQDRPAVTGVSRSGRMRQHHGADRDEQTPEELQDEMDADLQDDDVTEAPAAAQGHALDHRPQGISDRQQPVQPASVTAKRRRVVVDDDEDDD